MYRMVPNRWACYQKVWAWYHFLICFSLVKCKFNYETNFLLKLVVPLNISWYLPNYCKIRHYNGWKKIEVVHWERSNGLKIGDTKAMEVWPIPQCVGPEPIFSFVFLITSIKCKFNLQVLWWLEKSRIVHWARSDSLKIGGNKYQIDGPGTNIFIYLFNSMKCKF